MMSVLVTPLYRSQARVWPLPMVVAWIIWRRNRSMLTGICSFLAVTALLANTVCTGILSPLNGLFSPNAATTDDSITVNYGLVTFVFTAVILGLLWCSVVVMVSACLFNAGATAKDYPFPGYLMRAPVSSVGLAACPLSIGALMMVCLWLFAHLAILRPLGFDIPLGESVSSAALAVVFLPAAMWSPLSPGLKGLFMLGLGTAYSCVLVSAHHAPREVSYIEWASAAMVLTAIAVAGLGRLRRGELNIWTWPESIKRLQERFRRSPRMLASALAAQGSLEWRGTGAALPGVLLILAFASLHALLFRGHYSLAGHEPETQGIHVIMWAVVMQFFVVGIPVYTAILSLVQVGNEYMLTRPMSSEALVASRFYAGARSAAFTVLLSGLLFAVWLVTPADDGRSHAALGSLLVLHGGQAFARTMAFYALIWAVVIFRLRLDGYSLSLSASQSLGGWHLLVDYLFLALLWVNLPQLNLVGGAHVTALPPWVYLLAASKAVAGACVLGYIVKRRLMSQAALAKAGVLWFATAAIVYFVALALLPPEAASFGVLALGVFLAMPVVRLSLGPVLLSRNRHR